MQADIEIIAPHTAKAMLERNTHNRPLSEAIVRRFTADMKEGRWKSNGAAIVFSSSGVLLDGQHRLHAVIRANTPLAFLVVRNADDDAFDTIDNGKSRTVADVLALMGVPNASVAGAAGRLAFAYATGAALNLAPGRTAITAFVDANPALQSAARLAKSKRHLFPTGPLAAVLFLGNASGSLDDEAAEFVAGISTGVGLERGDARHTLREWFINEKHRGRGVVQGRATFAATARAWNAYASGKGLTVIKKIANPTRETLPIFGFDEDAIAGLPPAPSERPRINGRFAPRETLAAA